MAQLCPLHSYNQTANTKVTSEASLCILIFCLCRCSHGCWQNSVIHGLLEREMQILGCSLPSAPLWTGLPSMAAFFLKANNGMAL